MIDLNARAASFTLNGAFVELVPAKMERPFAGVFVQSFADGLTATLELREFPTGAVFQRLRLKNGGVSNTGELCDINSFDRTFPAGETAVCESLYGDDCSARSFLPRAERLQNGDSLTMEPKGGRPADTDAFPFFDLDTGAVCRTFGVGWTGHWALTLEKTEKALRVRVGLSLVRTYLEPGEDYRTASVLYVTADSAGESRRRFRREMFRLGPHPVRLPIAEQNYDRYSGVREDWATVEGQRRCAGIAKTCEMDTLWLDAAWFEGGFPNGVGNFGYAPGFPNGTGEVSAAAHEKGLKYIQWFEPLRANAYSDTVREHRRDVLLPKTRGSVNCLVDIGDPQVRGRITALIKKHIREDGVDIYREDFNICPLGYWQAADPEGRRGVHELRFVNGFYEFWDALHSEFPGLLIDNCASGGRRIDLETSFRAVPLWRSDTACFEESAEHRIYECSQNQILGLTRYLPYHASGAREPSAYAVRSVASGGAALNFDVFAPGFDPAAVRPFVNEIRALQKYWSGDFYPLAEATTDERVWAAWQLALPDGSGAVYAFRRPACEAPSFAPGLCAIEENASYLVTLTDEEMQKTELRLNGDALRNFRFTCDRPRSSVILEYRRA